MSFFQELRRRKVFRVGAAYAIVAWLLIQIAATAFPTLQLPPWTTTLVTVLVLLGFPVALVLAWAFELTPDGIRPSQPASGIGASVRGTKLDYVLIAGLGLVAGVTLLSLMRTNPASSPAIELSGRPSIAVLPFEDMSAEGDQEYFGDGIADELLNELTRLEGIDVASRTSAFAFKGSAASIAEIGEVLRVKAVLEGGIRKSGDTVRVTAQLINVADGYHIWSQTYDRKLTDIFRIQEEIASTVAGALGVQLGVGGANAFRGAGTRNIEAYEQYLRGVASSTPAEQIRLLKRAVELDPNYAAAWAELGLATTSQLWSDVPRAAPRFVEAGMPYLERAIELDPGSAAAHTLLGTLLYARNRWSEGRVEHDKAIALRPTFESLGQSGNLLFRAGQSREALARWAQAVETDPLRQQSLRASAFEVYALIALGRFTDAEALLPEVDESRHDDAALLLALSAGTSEDVRAAIMAIGDPRAAVTALYTPLLAVYDDRAAALALLHDVHAAAVEWPSKWHDVGRLAAYFGDPAFALEVMGEEARYAPPRDYALWMPFMAGARTLPEFKQLVADMHLVEYWREYGWSDFCRPVNDTDFVCN